MKKLTKKALELKVETIRVLSDQKLEQVNGGVIGTVTAPSNTNDTARCNVVTKVG